MAFVVFEGLDGSGKSTLLESVVQELSKLGLRLVTTREPGGTRLSEAIRRLLLAQPEARASSSDGSNSDLWDEVPSPVTELLLYEAARAQNVDQVIRPALASGAWVLADRYSPSTVAFQAHARGLDLEMVGQLNKVAEQGCRPDLIVLVDLPAEEGQRRLAQRSAGVRDRMESERAEFHERVRQGYLAQAQEEPSRWLVLNGLERPELLLRKVLDDSRLRAWLSKGQAR